MVDLLARVQDAVAEDASQTLDRFARLPEDHPDREALRQRVIEMYLPMAAHLARRVWKGGDGFDDLLQVATVGLIKAVDGFDVSRESEFVSYAVPTIAGELKRYFRDKTWDVRVPRRVQELKLAVQHAVDELTQWLKRSPTVADIATYLGVSEEDVLEADRGALAYNAVSLDVPVLDVEGEDLCLGDTIGDLDQHLEGLEDKVTVQELLRRLPRREQQILAMRFFGNKTQSQIGAELGLSQMHVSRLLARSLARMRRWLLTADAAA